MDTQLQKQTDLHPNSTQEWLITEWRKLFDTQDITIDSDFFELGANSLTVIKLLSRIEREFGEDLISLDTFFEKSQLWQIAREIDKSRTIK